MPKPPLFPLFAAVAAVVLPAAAFAQDVAFGQFSGTASGFLETEVGNAFADVAGGETATQVFTGVPGPGAFNQQVSPSGFTQAGTGYGLTKARADSRGTTDLVYAGSYWGDLVTFTGGVGEFELALGWDVDFALNDSGGDYTFGPSDPTTGGTNMGRSAIRYRNYIGGGFGGPNINPSPTNTGPDFFLQSALQDGFADVPFYDPQQDGDGSMGSLGSIDSFGYEIEVVDPDTGDVTIEMITGPMTTESRDSFAFFGGGARFTWEYGVPLAVGQLLEVWAQGGAQVDAFNTGTYAAFEVPAGTSVSSESGFNYTVTTVPEPTSAAAILFAAGLLARRRR